MEERMDSRWLVRSQRRLSEKFVFGSHRAEQTHRIHGRKQKDESHAAKAGHQERNAGHGPSDRVQPEWLMASSSKDKALTLALVYRSEVQLDIQYRSSRCWGLNLPNEAMGSEALQSKLELEVVPMKIEFFKGRRWLATASLATAFAVTGFYGLRAASRHIALRESGADHQNGPALRGGFWARVLGRGEARPAGRG